MLPKRRLLQNRGTKGSTRQSTPSPTGDSDQTVESLALAGATAIQHLITERDGLRGRAHAQEDELVGLRAANEDLRCPQAPPL